MDVALETITGYLNLKDLLQVRYLNTAWNEAAKRRIRNHYFNLFREEDILKLSDLIRKGNRKSFISPFQKLNIHFIKPSFYHLQRFMKQYGNLFVGYRITFNYPIQPATMKAMIHVLNNSPNLKMLEFADMFGEEVEILYPKLHFSKLTSLLLGSFPKTSGINFLKKILDASPSLKFLKICEIDVEMTSLISVLANRNVEVVMEEIFPASLPVNSSFNGNFPINLTSVSFINSYNDFIQSKKLSEFVQQYTHTIKYLEIKDLNLDEDLQIPTMNVLETLYLNYHLSNKKHLNKFSRGQFPSLKKLKLELNKSWEFINHFIDSDIPLENVFLDVLLQDEAELNILVDTLTKFLAAYARKLKQLELILDSAEENKSPGLIRLSVDLPALEFLKIDTPLSKTFQLGKTENVHKLMMYDGFEYNQLQFPNLKSVFITVYQRYFESLYKLYENPIGIEELTLELRIYSEFPGLDWKILTGLNRGNEDFISEAIKMVQSNDLLLAQDLFKDSKPNIGNIRSLQTLNIRGNARNAAKAILFMVFCGKLKNLRKYRTCIKPYYDTCPSTVFDDVFSLNNTQFAFVPPKYKKGEDITFLEPFTTSIISAWKL